MTILELLIAAFALINLVAFFLMWQDKRKSLQGGNVERTPEGLIFLMAAAFGSLGVFLGMHAFRHKTRKWYFQVGIPLLIIQNVATVYVVWEMLVRVMY
jgi:uncharacterized membrane protein YsdA (DUF1294 family)